MHQYLQQGYLFLMCQFQGYGFHIFLVIVSWTLYKVIYVGKNLWLCIILH